MATAAHAYNQFCDSSFELYAESVLVQQFGNITFRKTPESNI